MNYLMILFFTTCYYVSVSQTTTTDPAATTTTTNTSSNQQNEDEGAKESVLGVLLSYNFSGNKKGLSNFTPVVNYGWSKQFSKDDAKNKWVLSINPYAAGQIDIDDSASFLPGLMLPGVAGLRINNYISFTFDKITKTRFIFSPNFGYKLMSDFADSSSILAQHNARLMLGIEYDDLFILAVQYTHAWHNSTSDSKKLFQKIFSTNDTEIGYMMVSLQTKLNKAAAESPSYFFLEWRGVTTRKAQYKAFDNSKIVTLGVRKDMSLDNAAPAVKSQYGMF